MNSRISKPLNIGLGTSLVAIMIASCALIPPSGKVVSKSRHSKNKATETSLQTVHLDATHVHEIKLPSAPAQEQSEWTEYSIKSGDSLSAIFAKLNFSRAEMNKIIQSNKLGKSFTKLAAGKTLQFKSNNDGQLLQLTYKKNTLESLIATLNDDHFVVEQITQDIDIKVTDAQINIQGMLYRDAKNSGLSDKTAMQLVNIFDQHADPSLEIKSGDQITILYEQLFSEDRQIGVGNIIAAELVTTETTRTIVRYKSKTGQSGYYQPDGKQVQQQFLHSPIKSARITSHFNLHRKHPVLKRIKPHKGVDYSAKTGTPIQSTANGEVTFRGWKTGFGRVVIIQHGDKYSTLYAHLSRFGRSLKVGDKVSQGKVIGYVGRSGRATGPHLHYELHVNGVPKNPLRFNGLIATVIDKSILGDFKKQTQPILNQLSQAKSIYLAKNDNYS